MRNGGIYCFLRRHYYLLFLGALRFSAAGIIMIDGF
jgi:hypothetical protein